MNPVTATQNTALLLTHTSPIGLRGGAGVSISTAFALERKGYLTVKDNRAEYTNTAGYMPWEFRTIAWGAWLTRKGEEHVASLIAADYEADQETRRRAAAKAQLQRDVLYGAAFNAREEEWELCADDADGTLRDAFSVYGSVDQNLDTTVQEALHKSGDPADKNLDPIKDDTYARVFPGRDRAADHVDQFFGFLAHQSDALSARHTYYRDAIDVVEVTVDGRSNACLQEREVYSELTNRYTGHHIATPYADDSDAWRTAVYNGHHTPDLDERGGVRITTWMPRTAAHRMARELREIVNLTLSLDTDAERAKIDADITAVQALSAAVEAAANAR